MGVQFQSETGAPGLPLSGRGGSGGGAGARGNASGALLMRSYHITIFGDCFTVGAASRAKAIYRAFIELNYKAEGWTLLDFTRRAVSSCRLFKPLGAPAPPREPSEGGRA